MIGQVYEPWMDDDDVPAGWPAPDQDQDPGPAEPPWWLTDEFCGRPDAEHAAWLASLPEDIRADYLSGPYTGAGEVIPVGFTHRDPGGPSGAGFAAGGALDQLAPGPSLARELAEATAAGHDKLTDSEQIGVLCAWQRQVAWAQAGLASAVSAMRARRLAQATRPGWSGLADHITDELAVTLTLTGRSAERLRGECDLLDWLPAVRAALAAGRIDWPRATLIVGQLAVLDDDTAARIASRLLDRAPSQTTAQLRTALARAVLAADPAAARRRQREGRKDTRVDLWAEPSGNTVLAGRELRPADAIAASAQLDADARWLRDHGTGGTLAELRAAAYLTRLTGRDLTTLLPAGADGHGEGSADGTAETRTLSDAGTRADGNDNGGVGADANEAGSADGNGEGGGHSSAEPRTHSDAEPRADSNAETRTLSDAEPRGDADADGAGQAAPGRRGGAGGPQPGGSINLTMPLSAFSGLDDHPGEAAGYGTIDAATARDLATLLAGNPATRWCLTFTLPNGQPVAHACAGRGPASAADQPVITWAASLRRKLQILESGTCSHARRSPSYPWPSSLRHLIEIRQRTCAAPGCRRPARRCDIDHTVPFEKGGVTCECNGSPLCRHHHRCKQVPGWHLTQQQPGQMTWQTPGGRQYTTTGDPYPV